MKLLWKHIPNAELHVIGAAEPYHEEYYRLLLNEVGEEKDVRVFSMGNASM